MRPVHPSSQGHPLPQVRVDWPRGQGLVLRQEDSPVPCHCQTEPMSSSAPAASSVLTPHLPVDDPVVSARNLTKVYGRGSGAVTALDSVNVDIARARFTAIMGPSGSGKSTLMHCLAGLDSITSGEIMLDGDMVSSMNQRRLTRLRRERIGFIFQSFNLVPTLTAAENITLPLDIARKKVNPQRFDQVIDAVGLRERLSHRPAELSSGCKNVWFTVPNNSPAVNSNALLLCAHYSPARRSSSPTSPPATWTPTPPTRSWRSCAAASTTWGSRWSW